MQFSLQGQKRLNFYSTLLGSLKLILLINMSGAILFGCSHFPKITIIKDPLSPIEHLTLGFAYEKDGQLDLAEREYKLAEPLPFATYSLGNIYTQKGDYEKAESYYRSVLRGQPMPEALNNLAFILLLAGKNLEEAYKLATLAVEEGIKQNLDEDMVKNFKNTLNQVEMALMQSKRM
jgi:tetratricopeptide (TPR) repeat protein